MAFSMSTLKKSILFIMVGLFIALLISWLVAGTLISPASYQIKLPKTDLPIEAFSLESDSGEVIAGWHLSNDAEQGVIVLFHGIRGSRLSMLKRMRMLYENGYSVVAIDFQAHGQSTGHQITLGYLEKFDVVAAIEFAKSKHMNEAIGIIGVSLGGASTILAKPQHIDAIVVESVYKDINSAIHNRVNSKLGALSWLPAEILLVQLKPRLGFDISELSPISEVALLKSPIFFIAGLDDTSARPEDTLQLFYQAKNPKELWMIEGIAHQDIYDLSPVLYEQNVLCFLKSHMNKGPKECLYSF